MVHSSQKTTEFRANLEFAMNRFAFVADEARWQCPRGVTFLPVVDLNFPVPIYLIWRKDNQSPLLQKFLTQVEALTAVGGWVKIPAGRPSGFWVSPSCGFLAVQLLLVLLSTLSRHT